MAAYTKLFSTRETPQSEPTTIATHKNRAGGYGFKLDKWQQLDRFLILGSDKPTYYASAKEMTVENAQNVLACIKEDGLLVVTKINSITTDNRAPKKSPALFALALCCKHGDTETRRQANDLVTQICGTPTMLWEWMEYVKTMGGWGSGSTRAIKKWYNSRDPKRLAYQMVKYRQRNGWTHRDTLRVAHPVGDELHDRIYKWVLGKEINSNLLPEIINAYENCTKTTWLDDKDFAGHVQRCKLPRECVPTEYLKSKYVWDALLEDMPFMAMVRNLGVMSSVGLLVPMSNAAKDVTNRLNSKENIKKSRMHPYHFLAALKTYAQGKGVRGSKTWTPVPSIVDALNDAFYESFKNIETTGKNFYLGLDVSGSMFGRFWGQADDIFMPCEVAAAMAMATIRTEPNYYCAGFCHEMRELGITKGQRLDSVLGIMRRQDFGRTDCALPIIDAFNKKLEVDTFLIYTDNETWAGTHMHPYQALEHYRQKMGRDAKLVVTGVTATDFTIANPGDAGMLDVVGFDASAPQIISDFAGDKF